MESAVRNLPSKEQHMQEPCVLAEYPAMGGVPCSEGGGKLQSCMEGQAM